ncbi:MAG TPA: ATP-dependent DNA helicase [Actinomycetaceae bacterium]|nr:ATP-dependent DNA helicase [Actinomycetaceae bacterium]
MTVSLRHSALEIAAAVNKGRPRGEHIVPTAEQIAVIEAPLAPVLVVAGAGSGKTATMADRVVWLVVNGLARPDEVLGLTFTRKAAGELAERVRRNLRRARAAGLFDGDALETTMSTYNSFAAGVVRDHALRVGRDPDAGLITAAGVWQIMDEVVRNWPGGLRMDCAPGTVTKRAMKLAEELRGHLVSVEEARDHTRSLLPEFERVASLKAPKTKSREINEAVAALNERLGLLGIVEVYLARLRELGLVEFSDQVAIACEIARKVPAVGRLMRSQYRAVLLDEFQDTSVAQLQFLVDLFGPGFAAMAVGDPNQAIYGWRGASASSLVSFRDGFSTKERPTQVCHLTTSWRNDEAILDAANVIASPLVDDRSGAGSLLRPLGPRPQAGSGTVHRSVAMTEEEEAGEIARWVAERWRPGERTAAVLCRAGNQFAPLLRAFRHLGIEPKVVGLKGLLSTPEVIDLRAALEIAADPSRGDSMMRLLTNARLGLADLHVLAEWSSELAGEDARGDDEVSAAIVEAVASPPPSGFHTRAGHRLSSEGLRRIRRLDSQLREIRAALTYPLTDLVITAERALLLDIELAARPGADPGAARANLDAFAVRAGEYAAGVAAPTLSGFLSWLAAADEEEKGLEMPAAAVDENSVQILTMHASKGLEWDVVALAGLTEGTFPSRRNYSGKLARTEKGWVRTAGMLPAPLRGDAKYLPEFDDGAGTPPEFQQEVRLYEEELFEHSILEERRIAYVAVTRARQELLLSGSHYRGGKRPLEISRFLSELAGVSAIPDGYFEVPPPDEDAERPETEESEALSYPGTDPLIASASHGDQPTRRERLMQSAAAVERGRAAVPGLSLDDAAAIGNALEQLAGRAAEPGSSALVEDVGALLREAAARRAAVEVEMPRHLSASSAMAMTRSPGEFVLDLRRPVPRRPSTAARLGNEFHAWVENHFRMPAFAGEFGFAEDAPAVGGAPERLAALKSAFIGSEWASRVPEAVEVDLETRIAGQLIRCRIDAVFRVDGRVTVVDWKTGAEPASQAETDHRRLQLEIYRLAYSRAHGVGLDDIEAAFHYVASDVTRASGMWTEAEIENKILHSLDTLGAFDGAGALRVTR